MISSRAVVALLLASTALACINTDFQSVLQGQAELTDAHIEQMYEQYLNEYKHAPARSLQSSHDRKVLFANKVREIAAHNADETQEYKKGLNEFSDMTDDEFNEHFHLVGSEQHCSATRPTQRVEKKFELQDIPSYWDWRNVRGVTPVKNQGKCGSCWTFSTIGSIESHYLIKYNQFRNLSEQQLVDCAGNYDNHGCAGGLPSHAFEYIQDIGGIATEKDYVYTATDDTCKYKKELGNVAVKGGSVNITQGDESELQHAIFEHGPVSVCYQVYGDFRDYKTGVWSSSGCKSTTMDVNHAVLAVGYGTENNTPYWIVKNSWGTAWGDEGYFKIKRGVNMCGIAVCNSFPKDVVALKDYPTTAEEIAEFTI